MKNLIFFVILIFTQRSWAQTNIADTTKYIIKDTTLILAKEYCSESPTICWFGDNIHLNKMIIFNGNYFWRNYPIMLFYFSGLDLRNYQENNNIDYDYFQKVEDSLKSDISNDSNLVTLITNIKNKRNKCDTFQFKLYEVAFRYVFIKKSEEYMPNLFNSKFKSSYIYYPTNVYYILEIKSIKAYNKLPLKNRILLKKEM